MNLPEAKPLSQTIRFFLLLGAFGLAMSFLHDSQAQLNPVLLSLLIVMTASPLLRYLQKRMPPVAAALVTLVIIIVLGILLVLFLAGSVGQLAEVLPTYKDQLSANLSQLDQALDDLGLGQSEQQEVTDLVDPEELLETGLSFLGTVVSALSNIVVIILMAAFLLIDALNIEQKVEWEVARGSDFMKRASTMSVAIRRYMIITAIVGSATGGLDAIFFLIVGVDFALLWGVVAFFFSYIPIVGFWFALIPPVLLAWLEFGWLTALVVFLGIVIINGFAENVVKPRYMSSGLNLSFFTVFFSLTFWSAVLGPLGAILSIPLTVAVKELVLAPDPQNRWLATLLSAKVPQEEAAEAAVTPPDG